MLQQTWLCEILSTYGHETQVVKHREGGEGAGRKGGGHSYTKREYIMHSNVTGRCIEFNLFKTCGANTDK